MPSQMLEGLAGETIKTIAANARRMAFFCLAVAVLTAAWSLFAKPRYSATAVVIVPASTQSEGLASLAGNLLPEGLGALSGLASSLGGQIGMPGGFDIDVVQRVISSRPVMERIILKYDLVRRYRAPTMQDALRKLMKRTRVTLTQQGFIEITAQGETREEAAEIARDIVEFANDELSTLVTSRARRARIEAENLLVVALDSLQTAQVRLRDFRDETGLLFPEEQGNSMVTILGTIESEMIVARSELSGAAASLSPGSPAYREAAARVSLLERAMQARLTGSDSLTVLPAYDSLPDLVMRFDGLYMEVEMRRMVVLMLRQQLESLRLEEARDSPTLEMIEPPVPAKLRTTPKRAILVIKMTLAAFVLGCLWMMVLTYFRRLMRDPVSGRFWREVWESARTQMPRRGRTEPAGHGQD